VFFDYFPHPSQALGERPDEELKMMEEERFLLRVARDDLAEQLAGRYPEATTDFADSGQLNRFVENLLAEAGVEELVNPLDAIPEDVPGTIGELRAVQSRTHHGPSLRSRGRLDVPLCRPGGDDGRGRTRRPRGPAGRPAGPRPGVPDGGGVIEVGADRRRRSGLVSLSESEKDCRARRRIQKVL
jgi:hypothetical protein